MTAAILFIGIVLFLGQVFSSLFAKTRLPDVLPLMLLGMLMGPITGLVRPEDFGHAGEIFTTLALIVVLFQSGIELKILSLRGAMGQGFLLTTIAFSILTIVLAWVAHLTLGVPQLYAFIIGAIVADNSTAVVTPLLDKLKISPQTRAILFLEANLTGVYSIVLALALLGIAVKGGTFTLQGVGLEILQSFAIGLMLSIVAGLFWMRILNRVRSLENAVSLTFAFVLLVYGLSELAGGDGAIATLTFGAVAGNMRLLRRLWLKKVSFNALTLNNGEKSFFEEVEFIFKTLFFVYMGISMRIGEIHLLALGLFFSLAKILVRAPCVNWCVSKKITRSDCSVILAMCPNGLVSAVLAAMIAQHLPENGRVIQDVIYSVIFFSVMLSSLMSFRIEKGGLLWIGEHFFLRHCHSKIQSLPSEESVENNIATDDTQK
ncbi:MAG: cation:proton antiporter [Elusimicrobiaceae bacterium]|nr:cation:proton antiporter [Elusimicrobiaceae bacterium]